MADWHVMQSKETEAELSTSLASGLTPEEAAARFKQYGPNTLTGRGTKEPWKILAEQFKSLLVILLIVAAFVSGVVLREWVDCAVILVIVILNALLGFRQEFKAEKAMEALKKLSMPGSRVTRGGAVVEVPSDRLVPGDVLHLEAGNMLPADVRLFETADLKIEEASLTGESVPVTKKADTVVDRPAPIGDRVNMAYMGTAVTSGRGVGVVTGTGMATELGKIAGSLQAVEKDQTPLQKQLHRVGTWIVIGALILIGVVGVVGLLQGNELKTVFLTAVSMAVAAVPEGLPAVVTIALALGAQRMLERKALIRKLPAVETLGSVTTICSDKTGTLTQNRMTVTLFVQPGGGEEAVQSAPPKETDMEEGHLQNHPFEALMLQAGALCSDAVLTETDNTNGSFDVLGDPTEGALVIAAAEAGLGKKQLEAALPRESEVPFDSERKRMTTMHKIPRQQDSGGGRIASAVACIKQLAGTFSHIAFTKGAVDSVVEAATHFWKDGAAAPLSDQERYAILKQNADFAGKGIRVLGIAYKLMEGVPENATAGEVESGLVYVGMLGMVDPVRPEVCKAVSRCVSAGIRPVMITGDHPRMAEYIGRELGMAGAGEESGEDGGGARVVTGRDLAEAAEPQLRKWVKDTNIFARVAPEHKLNIVDALQANGEVCAMTGDGVNDAPALKSADIGVAMGITGTDVSKEASDMVLQDDNFATIVAAVEEGRTIFSNIRRFIRFLLACNTGELWVFLLAPVLGMPLPLLPVQILWMNLVTDGFPALGLGVEKAEPDIMDRPPRNPRAPILNRSQGIHILYVGLLIALVSLLMGYMEWHATGMPGADPHHEGALWQTMVFCTMVFSQLFLAFAERSDKHSLFSIGVHTNPYVLVSVLGAVLLQCLIVYVPAGQTLFKTIPLSAGQLLLCFSLGMLTLAAVEVEKFIKRRFVQQTTL